MSTPKEVKVKMPKHALGDVVESQTKVATHAAGHRARPQAEAPSQGRARTAIRSQRPGTKTSKTSKTSKDGG